MKKISSKLFFTVMWKGFCQAVVNICKFFGYNKEGKFAKYLWRSSVTLFLLFVACFVLECTFNIYDTIVRSYRYTYSICEAPNCYNDEYVSQNIRFHNDGDGKGYIFDIRSHDITLKRIAWIAKPLGNDSLVCYSDGKKRGYFNKFTGKVTISPKYSKAWIFSDGLASVEEDGMIKFIDSSGKTVIDKKQPYIEGMQGYVFHNGYCVVDSEDGEKCGMMDKKGEIVVPLDYSSIEPSDDLSYWVLNRDGNQSVIDNNLNVVIPELNAWLRIRQEYIEALMLADNTIRHYDLQGNLINDCYITNFNYLEYDTEESYMQVETYQDEEGESHPYETQVYKTARAKLCSYQGAFGKEGLITIDGHIVTPPLYENIRALSANLYMCDVADGDNILLNSKGQVVK